MNRTILAIILITVVWGNLSFAQQTSRCDINSDGRVDSLDAENLRSLIASGESCPSCDLNRDGQVNDVDLQLLTNVILGKMPCPSCTAYSFSPTSRTHGPSAETGNVTVTAESECFWSAGSNQPWITLTSSSSGYGSGILSYALAANPNTAASRNGSITIAGVTFSITQQAAACVFTISSSAQAFNSSGGNGVVAVTTTTGCGWIVEGVPAWVTLTSGSGGTGSGTVNYSVAANTGSATRSTTVIIAGQAYFITQAGVGCTFTLSSSGQSFSRGGGSGSVSLTGPASCTWTVDGVPAWITIVLGSSGTGNGTVSYSVSANPGSSSRTASLSIGGTPYTVTQSADPIAILTGITPSGGPVTGGTTLVISGTGFQAGVSVSIGPAPAAVGSVSDSQIAATSGVGFLPGTFDVIVTNPGSSSATLTNAFTYTPVVPVPTRIEPDSKIESDSSFTLRVFGSDFTRGTTVLWNGNPRVTRFLTNSELQASIPSSDLASPGSALVSVSLGGVTASTPVPFTIRRNDAQSEITGLLPRSLSQQGSTRVTIQGRNFRPQLITGSLLEQARLQVQDIHGLSHCPFTLGGVCITDLQFVNSSELSGTAPPNPTGAVDLTLIREDGTQSNLPQASTYKTLPPAPPAGGGGIFTPKLRQRIPFVADTGEFRTNLGINNLAPIPASVDILLINQNGQVDPPPQTVTVPPFGMTQVNDVARLLEGPGTNLTGRQGYLILESSTPFRAWASQITNLTEDPSIEQSRNETAAGSRVILPTSASVNEFLTSLLVINHTDLTGMVQVRSRNLAGAIQGPVLDFSLKPNGYLSMDNFYQELRLSGVSGPIELEASGGVKISAFARIYTPQGTSGYLEGVAVTLASRDLILPYSVENLEFRTNLGITNPGSTPAQVTVTFFGKDGLQRDSFSRTVPANGMVQINRVNAAFINGAEEGYLRLEANQPIFGWTSQIDNFTSDLSLVVGKSLENTGSKLFIPSTVSTEKFKSALTVVNLDATSNTIQITARNNDGIVLKSSTVTISGKGFVAYSDILASLGLGGNFGPIELTSTSGKPILAVSRVYSPLRTGGYFEGVIVQ